jgi:hypothetical protein
MEQQLQLSVHADYDQTCGNVVGSNGIDMHENHSFLSKAETTPTNHDVEMMRLMLTKRIYRGICRVGEESVKEILNRTWFSCKVHWFDVWLYKVYMASSIACASSNIKRPGPPSGF